MTGQLYLGPASAYKINNVMQVWQNHSSNGNGQEQNRDVECPMKRVARRLSQLKKQRKKERCVTIRSRQREGLFRQNSLASIYAGKDWDSHINTFRDQIWTDNALKERPHAQPKLHQKTQSVIHKKTIERNVLSPRSRSFQLKKKRIIQTKSGGSNF